MICGHLPRAGKATVSKLRQNLCLQKLHILLWVLVGAGGTDCAQIGNEKLGAFKRWRLVIVRGGQGGLPG